MKTQKETGTAKIISSFIVLLGFCLILMSGTGNAQIDPKMPKFDPKLPRSGQMQPKNAIPILHHIDNPVSIGESPDGMTRVVRYFESYFSGEHFATAPDKVRINFYKKDGTFERSFTPTIIQASSRWPGLQELVAKVPNDFHRGNYFVEVENYNGSPGGKSNQIPVLVVDHYYLYNVFNITGTDHRVVRKGSTLEAHGDVYNRYVGEDNHFFFLQNTTVKALDGYPLRIPFELKCIIVRYAEGKYKFKMQYTIPTALVAGTYRLAAEYWPTDPDEQEEIRLYEEDGYNFAPFDFTIVD